MTTSDSDMARLQADVDEEIKTEAKIQALKRGITLSQLVEEALRQYLGKIKK